MKQPTLFPPGVVVNWRPSRNTRKYVFGVGRLDAVYLGIPFDGAGTVRPARAMRPMRFAGPYPSIQRTAPRTVWTWLTFEWLISVMCRPLLPIWIRLRQYQ